MPLRETVKEHEYLNILQCCRLCPRLCGVDRTAGQTGYCGIGANPRVSSAGPHFGEESVLVGRGGSGTIFFAGCNLRCVYCQNYDISQLRRGEDASVDRLVEIMLSLQRRGCENINFVSPSHVAAQIAEAVVRAKKKGLILPTVYNCGGYDLPETLDLLDGLIDVYMPDIKYADGAVAGRYSDAPDYPEVSREAIRSMHCQVGDLEMDPRGVARRGLLVRHLVLPDDLAGSEAVIDFLADDISPHTFINVMAQYRPCYRAGEYPELSRPITLTAHAAVLTHARRRGLRLAEE